MARATARGWTVLACHPVAAEATLAFASLADLFEPVADAVLPQLPEPQRLAFAVALMRASPAATGTPSARAVATATSTALRALAERTPVVLAIDDLQCLDRASAEALAFALRRVDARAIGLVAAQRIEDETRRDPLRLDTALTGRLERCAVEPLSASGLHHVIRRHLGHVFPRPTLLRITETSGGNPFFALELARALLDDAQRPPPPGTTLPVPDRLATLMKQRLARLPARTRELLLLAAATPAPTRSLLVRAARARQVGDALERARRAGIIATDDDRVRFTHPLLAMTIESSASASARRAAHQRLAALVANPEQRARHLAFAATRPDEKVARALDEAALLARRRGAPEVAAELQEQGACLTPPADGAARRRRRLQAAEHALYAGDRTQARALAEAVLADGPGSHERAQALHLLGRVCAQEDRLTDAIAHLEDALAHCSDARTRVTIRLDLAFAVYNASDAQRAIDVARGMVAEAEALGEPGLLACALAMQASGRFIAGLGSDRATIGRALALEDRDLDVQMLLRPTAIAGLLALYEARIDDAEALLGDICAWAQARGEESGIPFLLFNRSRIALLRGDVARAVRLADEALLLAQQAGSDRLRTLALVHRSRALGTRGDVAAARDDLATARALVAQTGHLQAIPWLLASEGLLALGEGDAAAASDALAPLIAFVEANGIREPMQAYFVPDAIEALTVAGDHTRAEALLDLFVRRAIETDRPWAIAGAVRGQALLAAACGRLDEALAAAEDAVRRWQELGMPIEHGRALLVLGQVRRRRMERRLAREVLEDARDRFARLGAHAWAGRAAGELGRLSIRRGAGERLTPTEERVAALAAAGRTNREVAQELFMSPKTVEANLARVYGKLGIHSRAELGARMAAFLAETVRCRPKNREPTDSRAASRA